MSPREGYDAEGPWSPGGEEREESFKLPAFFTDPLGVLKRRWPAVLATLILGLGATGAIGWLFQPTYVAQATLLITSQQIPEDFVRSTVREDSIANMTAMLGKVLSQEKLSRLLDRFDLYSEDREGVSQLALVNRMRANTEVAPVYRQGRGRESALVYGLSFRDTDPVLAADVANSLATLFVDANISQRGDQARRTTEFLRRELERDERELREQARLVSEFRRANRGVLPDELDTNLRKLGLRSQERASLVNQIEEKENRIAAFASAPGEAHFSENEMLLAEFRRQLARELAANTEEHPNVVALRQRIARQERIVAQERAGGGRPSGDVARLIEAERQEIERLKSRLAEVEDQIVELNERVDRTPAIGDELAALEQKAGVLREDYLAALRKVEAAKLAENLELAQEGAQVAILDRAQPPGSPEHPRWHIILGGVSAALALAVGIAVLLEMVDPVIVGTRQLEAIAEQPVLGSLPTIA